MVFKTSILSILLIFLSIKLFAYKVIEDVATKAGGYDIPIKIGLPEKSTEKMPVMFFVHGGGWNGGDDKEVPGAQIPADCDFLCDRMGIIYVGLAYRCKGNNGTFHLALQDLEASIKWFEERADKFNADMSRIGFSGASAGTTLSAVLANRSPNCIVYTGREGMYNVLDMDTTGEATQTALLYFTKMEKVNTLVQKERKQNRLPIKIRIRGFLFRWKARKMNEFST